MTARYIIGDVFDVLATLEPDSVDLVFSSPPFLALRSYLPADHPDKAKEIGSEATPADFLDTLLDVVEACDRVLAPHGSLCFELGDTYSGAYVGESSPSTGNNHSGGERIQDRRRTAYAYQNKLREGHAAEKGWPQPKSLCLIPTLFAASLAYGHNMLRPERTIPRWRVRNQIVWARSNPPVGALGDKYRPATSYVTVATKSPSRYFDLDAVRSAHAVESVERSESSAPRRMTSRAAACPDNGENPDGASPTLNPAGAPPLDYWVIPTHPYPGAHYATFPPDLVVKPVKSMCPQRVCRVCGEPSRRITAVDYEKTQETNNPSERGTTDGVNGSGADPTFVHGRANKIVETLGWTDCHCHSGIVDSPLTDAEKWRPGLVLDPFAGSGTTLAVATGHGRDAIGIDLDERNAELALDRVGPMFLTVEHLSDEGAA